MYLSYVLQVFDLRTSDKQHESIDYIILSMPKQDVIVQGQRRTRKALIRLIICVKVRKSLVHHPKVDPAACSSFSLPSFLYQLHNDGAT